MKEKIKRGTQTNEEASCIQILRQKSHQRDKHMGWPETGKKQLHGYFKRPTGEISYEKTLI